VAQNDAETNRGLEKAAAGDADGWRSLIALYHDRLHRLVHLRLDPRLRGRLDPSDVLQEAYLDAAKQLLRYVDQPELPFYLWLRQLTTNKLARLHRFHLGARKRDARLEQPLFRLQLPEASSEVLAEELVGDFTGPDRATQHAESVRRVRDTLDRLDPLDREALVLRHFEQLSGSEAAQVLGISPAAAGKRYIRALTRLKDALAQLPGGLEGLLS
jgi:RNA polymerase sigma-70 factor (ECF subfamily)